MGACRPPSGLARHAPAWKTVRADLIAATQGSEASHVIKPQRRLVMAPERSSNG